jgi:hypothetical protein
MRFATPFLTVCFVVLALEGTGLPAASQATPSPVPAAGASLEALLEKARTASGSPFRYHIVSRSREVHDGTAYEVTTQTEGLKYRAESCAKALCTGFYFDGERSYNTNFNDTALPVSAGIDGLQLTLRAIASYAFVDPDFTRNGGTLIEREPLLRAGKRYRRISVAPRLGALLDAIIDPETGLVVGVISDEHKYAFEFSDQRRIGEGITLPFSISLNGFTFTKYDERTVMDTPLEAPAGIVPEFSSGASRIAMARAERGAEPAVPCTIGGQSATCALDTGDSGLSMSLQLAKRLGAEPISGSFQEHGAGQYVSGVTKGPPLAIGSATYPAATYVVLHDLQQNGCDAVLGADVFAHARITFDFAKNDVTFAPAAGPGGGLPIGFDNFVPIVNATLGGKVAAFAVDTGAPDSIGLSTDFSDRHPDYPRTGDADVRLGSYDVKNVAVDAPEKMPFNGRIGTALLRRFVVTFDYERGTLSLSQ